MAGVSARQEGLVIERLVVSLAASLGLMEHCSFISTFRHASHVELVLDCIIKQLLLRLYAIYTGALVPKGLPNAVNHGLVRTGHRESLISAKAAPSPSQLPQNYTVAPCHPSTARSFGAGQTPRQATGRPSRVEWAWECSRDNVGHFVPCCTLCRCSQNDHVTTI